MKKEKKKTLPSPQHYPTKRKTSLFPFLLLDDIHFRNAKVANILERIGNSTLGLK